MADTAQARRRQSPMAAIFQAAGMAPFMLAEVQDTPRVVREARQIPPPARELRRVQHIPAPRVRADREPGPVPAGGCTVCLEDDVTFATTPPSNRCTHNPTVCTQCLSQHVRSAVIDSGLVEIRCPAANCRTVLSYDEVISSARGDRALVDRFDSLLLRQALGADATFVWCKNPDCGSGQYHDDGGKAHVGCMSPQPALISVLQSQPPS
ncbi:E3 ubiquitin-protein ligase RNF19B [Ceratobasidium sp. AG-Ba]|nr:E3 ubiquitin-protein ligase RNF19B [Ceratobasidium sp. AG-Ba]